MGSEKHTADVVLPVVSQARLILKGRLCDSMEDKKCPLENENTAQSYVKAWQA